MSCCLTTISHYLKQCWLIISGFNWLRAISQETFQPSVIKIRLENAYGQWINSLRPSDPYMLQQTNQHWFRQWLVAWSATSHYLNQCWDIVNWTLRNKLQWNFNRNFNIFIQKNSFDSIDCGMAAILSQPQCIKVFCTDSVDVHNKQLHSSIWWGWIYWRNWYRVWGYGILLNLSFEGWQTTEFNQQSE